mmetsp:Transcript_66059/g.190047  ORF Transcript_66059/g.190047 Transcript_66059/m.190047 type:complete len:225 (-) Transcript_66059:1109-1783(-)
MGVSVRRHREPKGRPAEPHSRSSPILSSWKWGEIDRRLNLKGLTRPCDCGGQTARASGSPSGRHLRRGTPDGAMRHGKPGRTTPHIRRSRWRPANHLDGNFDWSTPTKHFARKVSERRRCRRRMVAKCCWQRAFGTAAFADLCWQTSRQAHRARNLLGRARSSPSCSRRCINKFRVEAQRGMLGRDVIRGWGGCIGCVGLGAATIRTLKHERNCSRAPIRCESC